MTIIELIVAIALLGALVAIAGRALSAVTAGNRSLRREGIAHATPGVAMGTLRLLLFMAGPDEGRAVFVGDSRRARFLSYCVDPAGDTVRCHVSIEADSGVSGKAAIRRWTTGGPLIQLHGATLIYLAEQRGRHWITEWSATKTVPAAIAVMSNNDTTFFRVGRP